MSLSTGLHLRQSQSLVMTPQLIQSVKLLQYTSLELCHFIENQVRDNPLLEIIDASDENSLDNGFDLPKADAENFKDASSLGETANLSNKYSSDKGETANHGQGNDNMNEIGRMEKSLDVNLENVYPDDQYVKNQLIKQRNDFHTRASGEVSAAGYDVDLDSFAAQGPGMREALNEQIMIMFKQACDRRIAVDLLDHLDNAGYLQADLGNIAKRSGVEIADIERVLDSVQQCDPAGIFARNLGECLALQLRRRNRFSPAMKILIENLELLARRDYKSLKKLCDVNDNNFLEMIDQIQSLDPKPGACFEKSGVQTIIPDVFVREISDGEWHIELNSQTLPRVLVNRAYFTTVTRDIDKTSSDYQFMNECLQSANWLSRSLDQRANTIIKVASEIVRQQTDFFLKGISCLKPLNLKNVAAAINMHESTISRVTSNKYMMTPQGLFELKYFFNASIKGGDGMDRHSAEAIRYQIKEMIDVEGEEKILSDDDIVKNLRKDDIKIARRTVAKYRESMDIASSVQRRREKKLRIQDERTGLS